MSGSRRSDADPVAIPATAFQPSSPPLPTRAFRLLTVMATTVGIAAHMLLGAGLAFAGAIGGVTDHAFWAAWLGILAVIAVVAIAALFHPPPRTALRGSVLLIILLPLIVLVGLFAVA